MASVCSHESYPTSVDSLLLEHPAASHRIKYRGAGPRHPFDFTLETVKQPIDTSLIMPHFRAHAQPLDHRLSMYVGTESAAPIKVKVCRRFMPTRTMKFKLEVHSTSGSDVTIWLPSDFRGHIHRSTSCKKIIFSAGFTNRIMANVCVTQSRRPSVVSVADSAPYRFSEIFVSSDAEKPVPPSASPALARAAVEEDEVVVETAGTVTFRMWDIHAGAPEARAKEACKRVFGLGWCSKPSPEVALDQWDFLLED
ncbi:uncharacterized protein BXZ73DRAFT_92579 [Epithele typhae]|uniref:uncharacterized protein n=1 Tax=Epithele typhae TaxID=378194 RepID=UPI0020075361|nr:uncharacterized protein BXZ73DRAFT_92579 [Epithele typhae]KAH9915804.1 hypothetical protein BXZ73DRAFT_92579 [Epithele typhae]